MLRLLKREKLRFFELPPDKLKSYCDPHQFDFETTEEVAPLIGTIGQERAVSSIEFGFKIKTEGFNLFVAGPTGTGRHSTIRNHLKELAEKEPVPSDWCYVNNFSQPDRPLAIELAAGKGCSFARDMEGIIEGCKNEIPRAFESEEYERRKNYILTEFQSERDTLLSELRTNAEAQGFTVELTAAGIVSFPVINGKPLRHEEYEKLPLKQKREIEQKTAALQQEINRVLTKSRALEKDAKEKINSLDKEITLFVVGHLLDDLREKYRLIPKIISYLDAVQEDILANTDTFKTEAKKGEIILPGVEVLERESILERYRVNVLIDNCDARGAPVVEEVNPSYYNLLGRLEYQARLGTMITNFGLIKPGAIHRANGGYLLLNALDLLTNFFAWDALKRTLKSKEIRIENIGEQFRITPTTTLQPEPIPLKVKVVLFGSYLLYHLLYLLDEDFQKLFKVKADFNVEMDKNDSHLSKYSAFIAVRCQEAGLRHFDRSGVAKVVEYGSRLAEDQEKLSTRFLEIDNLLSEASFWASQEGDSYVSAQHVEKAIAEKIFRSNMIEEKTQELIKKEIILIDTDGAKVGQVNGISLLDLGDYRFGKPSRITAESYMGKAGVVNIEREAKLSGRIHSKGVLILSSYLGAKYALDKPLSMSATLCFEQLYEEIEGDSASSSELYAILSSLSGIPLKQGIAVTGSVNQKGEVQPVGGINHKIEGFFDVCKAKGLTGEQGVIIPVQNLKNLMLREDLIEAVRKGDFHIYAVRTIDEGIAILTGKEAGKRLADGIFKKGTINYLVNERLKTLAEGLREFEKKGI